MLSFLGGAAAATLLYVVILVVGALSLSAPEEDSQSGNKPHVW